MMMSGRESKEDFKITEVTEKDHNRFASGKSRRKDKRKHRS